MSWEERRISELEQQISDLKHANNSLRARLADKEQEVRRLEDDRDHANFRIRNELEPRIEREKRSYDSWALDPERR